MMARPYCRRVGVCEQPGLVTAREHPGFGTPWPLCPFFGALLADAAAVLGLSPVSAQSGLISGDFETGFTTAAFRARQEAAASSSAATPPPPSRPAASASSAPPSAASAAPATVAASRKAAKTPSRPAQPDTPKADTTAAASVTKRTCRPCLLLLSSRCAPILLSPSALNARACAALQWRRPCSHWGWTMTTRTHERGRRATASVHLAACALTIDACTDCYRNDKLALVRASRPADCRALCAHSRAALH